jgi:pimeloyl-ACP methyl ester carboxylesterase
MSRRGAWLQLVVVPCGLAVLAPALACRSTQMSSPSPTPTPAPSPTPSGPSASAACYGSDVQSMTLPLYWDRSGSPTFEYKFEVQRSSRPDVPFVVVVPGGPGAPSIGYASFAGGSIPADLNVVYTDPRGSNCNAPPAGHFPLDAYATEYLARDVKAVIERLQLQDFYVYGHSYGTVQATVLTSILERESTFVPSALVLEGILGRHLGNGYAEQIADFDTQWQAVKEMLDPGVAASFEQEPLPLGFTSRQWARYIAESLYEGVVPGVGIRLQIMLNQLAAGDPATDDRLTSYFSQLDGGFRYLVDPYVNAIGCRELYGTITGRDLVEGHLVPTSDDACKLLGVSFSDPYDSAAWPTTVPIYYFEGSNDPATPPSYAVYHFDKHRGSPRHFAYVLEASHDPLTQSLNTAGCSDAVWQSILFGSGTLRGALGRCSGVEVQLDDAAAQ